MAVSNQHGGGLTVQRVLQNDVQLFDQFIQISAFAKEHAPIDEIKNKCINLFSLADTYLNAGRLKKKVRGLLLKKEWFRKYNAAYIVKQIGQQINPVEAYWVIVPQSELSIRVTEMLHKKYNIRYAIWQMDDHIIKYDDNKTPFYADTIKNTVKYVMQQAYFRWVISPAMQTTYQKMFQVDSSVLFGPATQQSATLHQSIDASKARQFVYFGAVTAWQLDALIMFASLLPSLSAELHIYSAKDNLPTALKLPNVIYKGSVSGNEVIHLANSYDGIILPIAFDASLTNMTLLNIATKMSECLASGTVTVVIGPQDAAMVAYLQPHNCAVFVTDNVDRNAAIKTVQSIWDEEKRSTLLSNARKLVTDTLTVEPIYNVWRKGYEYLIN